MAIIYIPTINEWVSKTNRQTTDRQKVLTFVSEQIIKDQAPNCNISYLIPVSKFLEKKMQNRLPII